MAEAQPGGPALPRADVAAVLCEWLGVADVAVHGGPESGGWSNETIFLTADSTPLVLRLAPAGPSLLPHYDLTSQIACMRHAAEAGLPVPGVVAQDVAGMRFGRPAFVMERAQGRVPADDDPNFTRAGFLYAAAPHEQRRYAENLIDVMAAVHMVERPAVELPGPSAGQVLQHYRAMHAWTGRDDGWLDGVAAQLAADAPDDPHPPSLLWGDARPANTVVGRGMEIVAILDWEMAAAGPGEIDVAWWLEMDRLRAGRIPALPGFPAIEEVWERWERAVGRSARDRSWHHRLAAFRVTVLVALHLHALQRRGQMTVDHPLWVDNRGRRRLRTLMG